MVITLQYLDYKSKLQHRDAVGEIFYILMVINRASGYEQLSTYY